MPWGYLFGKNDYTQHKKCIYTVYIQDNLFIRCSVKMFPLYDWYNLKRQLIRKKVLCAKKKPNIPEAEGDREANSQHHKNCQK